MQVSMVISAGLLLGSTVAVFAALRVNTARG
jgi:hypothetical protein